MSPKLSQKDTVTFNADEVATVCAALKTRARSLDQEWNEERNRFKSRPYVLRAISEEMERTKSILNRLQSAFPKDPTPDQERP